MNLVDLVSADTASVPKKQARTDGGEYGSPCPWCGGTDRFRVWPTPGEGRPRFWCRQCHRKGDDINYVREMMNLGYRAACDYLNVQAKEKSVRIPRSVAPLPPAPTTSGMRDSVKITLAQVKAYHDLGRNRAIKYFGEYNLTDESIDKYLLGYADHPDGCSLPAGYTIPNLSLGGDKETTVRGCDVRRDEMACLAELQTRSPQWLSLSLADLSKKLGRNAELIDLVYEIWPAKYKALMTSENGIFCDHLVSLPDGSRMGAQMPAILVHEDKRSAMIMGQLGYPAVAYKPRADWDAHLPTVFSRVDMVYIVADNDDDPIKGMAIAQRVADAINVSKTTYANVVKSPVGYNDVGDLSKAEGLAAVRAWARSALPGVLPVESLEDL